jgi:hypothetical protein
LQFVFPSARKFRVLIGGINGIIERGGEEKFPPEELVIALVDQCS